MEIYSFYHDILTSFKYNLDTKILPLTIKHHEFNIGNPSLQLDNTKTNYELPTVIYNYIDSKSIIYHPFILRQSNLNNNSKFPVLYNSTKKLTLELQEELYEHNLDVLINCESQLSSLEIKRKIEKVYPIGKPLQYYYFYSFYEIPEFFINEDMFDIYKDKIFNLYERYDKLKDKKIYSFSVRYEPVIKLESSSLNLPLGRQKTYQLSLNFNIDCPIPLFIQIPLNERPLDDYSKNNKEHILNNIFLYLNDNLTINSAVPVEIKNNNIEIIDLKNIYRDKILPDLIYYYDLNCIYNSENLNLNLIYNQSKNNYKIKGVLSGQLYNPNIDLNNNTLYKSNLIGKFNKNVFNNYICNYNIPNPNLKLNYIEYDNTYYHFNNNRYIKNKYNLKNINNIKLNKINKILLKIKLPIGKKSNDLEYLICDVKENKYLDFEINDINYQYDLEFNIDNNLNLNLINLINNSNNSLEFEIIGILSDIITTRNYNTYGVKYVENINLYMNSDIDYNSNNIILEKNNLYNDDVFRSILLNKNNIDNNRLELQFELYDDENINNYNFVFNFNNKTYDLNHETNIYIEEYDINLNNLIFKFKDKSIYNQFYDFLVNQNNNIILRVFNK